MTTCGLRARNRERIMAKCREAMSDRISMSDGDHMFGKTNGRGRLTGCRLLFCITAASETLP